MQQTWTLLKTNGPDHLGFCLHQVLKLRVCLQMDADGSGRVDKEEFKSWWSLAQESLPRNRAKLAVGETIISLTLSLHHC